MVGSEHAFAQPLVRRFQPPARAAYPSGQRRASEIGAVPSKDLRLPIKRRVTAMVEATREEVQANLQALCSAGDLNSFSKSRMHPRMEWRSYKIDKNNARVLARLMRSGRRQAGACHGRASNRMKLLLAFEAQTDGCREPCRQPLQMVGLMASYRTKGAQLSEPRQRSGHSQSTTSDRVGRLNWSVRSHARRCTHSLRKSSPGVIQLRS